MKVCHLLVLVLLSTLGVWGRVDSGLALERFSTRVCSYFFFYRSVDAFTVVNVGDKPVRGIYFENREKLLRYYDDLGKIHRSMEKNGNYFLGLRYALKKGEKITFTIERLSQRVISMPSFDGNQLVYTAIDDSGDYLNVGDICRPFPLETIDISIVGKSLKLSRPYSYITMLLQALLLLWGLIHLVTWVFVTRGPKPTVVYREKPNKIN
ncbi:hypothetical protein NEDG_01621 [Nematocida displodere]|uniref:Translocon-associated protein subunit beta n=1 Tax=Nematocida displodere TaxID=1805483 RepID=A0A177EH58_9MICR|nr:hypothetical protein NEDG_01621 [Nematocida displodere]